MLDKFKTFIMQDSKRVWSGIIMIICLIVVFWINNFTLTWAIIGILYLIALFESTRLYKINFHLLSLILAIVLWIGIYFSNNSLMIALFVLCVSTLFVIINNNDLSIKYVAPFIYPTLPFVAVYILYAEYGVWYLAWLIIVVALSDIFAYYGGKRFGKTPLCSVSPKKTIEGALCGVFASVVIGSIIGIGIFGSFYMSMIASLVIVILSIIGDLFESALKRKAEVKDSGSILPGHGGILDRMDAILFGSVAMIACLSFLKMYHI